MPLRHWWRRALRRRPGLSVVAAVIVAGAAVAGFLALFSDKPALSIILDAISRAWDALTLQEMLGLALLVAAVVLLIAILAITPREAGIDEQSRQVLHDLGRFLDRLQRPDPSLAELIEEEGERRLVREAANLRPLRPAEAGLRLHEIANQVYAYAQVSDIAEYPRVPHSRWEISLRGDLSIAERLRHVRVTNVPLSRYSHVEIHSTPGGIFLVGFVAELELPKLETGRAAAAHLYLSKAEFAPAIARVAAEKLERAVQGPTRPPRLELTLKQPPSTGPPPPTAPAPAPPSSPESSG